MADRTTQRRWLEQLTSIPTASGHEQRVMAWVERWAGRRPDLDVTRDAHGNLLLTQKRGEDVPAVIAVAHTDHPGFVATAVDGRTVAVEFRGGVRSEYFDGARIEFFDSSDGVHRGTLTESKDSRPLSTPSSPIFEPQSSILTPGIGAPWSSRIGTRTA